MSISDQRLLAPPSPLGWWGRRRGRLGFLLRNFLVHALKQEGARFIVLGLIRIPFLNISGTGSGHAVQPQRCHVEGPGRPETTYFHGLAYQQTSRLRRRWGRLRLLDDFLELLYQKRLRSTLLALGNLPLLN